MIRLPAVFVLMATACSSLPAATAAQVVEADPDRPPRQVHVNAHASVKRAPDRATVQLAVETNAETAREASAENARVMERVLRALRGLDIPQARIQTLRIDLQPRYDHRRQDAAEPMIIGYRAINQVFVQLDDLSKVGVAVDAAIEAGANRVTGINFELAEPEEAYREALRMAIAKARAEAEVIAAALGEELGPPLNVSTGGFTPPRPMMRMESLRVDVASAPAPPPPVEPGELDITAHVSITFRLGT